MFQISGAQLIEIRGRSLNPRASRSMPPLRTGAIPVALLR
jgi:hypothetical protein